MAAGLSAACGAGNSHAASAGDSAASIKYHCCGIGRHLIGDITARCHPGAVDGDGNCRRSDEYHEWHRYRPCQDAAPIGRTFTAGDDNSSTGSSVQAGIDQSEVRLEPPTSAGTIRQ